MFWKTYFWVFMALSLSGFSLKGVSGIWGIIDLSISLGALVGVFLFAYRQVLFNSVFWRVYLSLFVAWELFNNVIIESGGGGALPEPAALVGFLFAVPSFLALYLYGFRFLKESSANSV